MPGIFRPAFQEGKREGGAPHYGKGPLYEAGDRSAPTPRAGSRDPLSTPPTPGRGVLRSRASNPAPPEKQKGDSCDSPSLCLTGAENGTRTRAARERPRSVVYTPGPWKGRLEVAGTSPDLLYNQHQRENLSGSPFDVGAENGTRTRDLNLGKVALYQLSYFRIVSPKPAFRDCKYRTRIPFCKIFQ